jgi:hypothetical protein
VASVNNVLQMLCHSHFRVRFPRFTKCQLMALCTARESFVQPPHGGDPFQSRNTIYECSLEVTHRLWLPSNLSNRGRRASFFEPTTVPLWRFLPLRWNCCTIHFQVGSQMSFNIRKWACVMCRDVEVSSVMSNCRTLLADHSFDSPLTTPCSIA